MPARRSNSRVTLSVRIDRALLEQVRTFVRDNAGKPLFTSMSTFVEGALVAHLISTAKKLDPERDNRRTTNSHR
jgi:hypothetical protein